MSSKKNSGRGNYIYEEIRYSWSKCITRWIFYTIKFSLKSKSRKLEWQYRFRKIQIWFHKVFEPMGSFLLMWFFRGGKKMWEEEEVVKRKSLAWRNFPKSIFLLNFFPFFWKDIKMILITFWRQYLQNCKPLQLQIIALIHPMSWIKKPLVNMCQAENIIKLTFLYTLRASDALESSE